MNLADLELAIEKRGGSIEIGGATIYPATRDVVYREDPDGSQFTRPERVWISDRLVNGSDERLRHDSLDAALMECGVQP